MRIACTVLALLGLIAGGPACIAVVPHAAPEVLGAGRAVYPDYTADELEEDRELLLANCTGCHSLAPGRRKTVEAWPEVVVEMRKEVGYDEETGARILRYLQVSRLYWEAERARLQQEREARKRR
jgi:hypothetical protein